MKKIFKPSFLSVTLLFVVLSFWSVVPAFAVTDWTLTYTGPNPANVTVTGTTVSIPGMVAPNCGKAIFTYGYSGLLGDLDTLEFAVSIVSGNAASVYVNIYLDNNDDGVFPPGRFFDERLDYVFSVAPGTNNLDTFAVAGGSAIRNVANPAPAPPTVTTGYTLAQAKTDNPGARVIITLNIGDTVSLGCNFNGTFVNATVEGTGFVPAPPAASQGGTPNVERITFLDGRINRFRVVAPIVVYPILDEKGEPGFAIYGVNEATSEGFLITLLTSDELKKVPTSPATSTLIKSNAIKGLVISRLPDGRLEFFARFDNGKGYVLRYIGMGEEYEDFETE